MGEGFKPLVIGCTGTQLGATDKQIEIAKALLMNFFMGGAKEFHHGDCIGADNQLAIAATDIGYTTISHPPTNEDKRAFHKSTIIKAAAPYLTRDQNIVDASDFLIALPKTDKEEIRSGTWATVRMGRKKGLKLFVIAPNGNVL